MPRQKKLGLALGGGAARGIAHIGILKALDEAGVRPQLIAGTSAGSIVGALFAAGYAWSDLLEVMQSLDWGDLVKPVLPRKGLLRAERLESYLDELLGGRKLEELEIPCRTVAVDLVQGEQHIFSDGPAGLAVRASCSVPGVFEPVETDDYLLVDGGVLNDVPVDVCLEMGADLALGIDLNGDMLTGTRPETIFQILTASFETLARKGRNHSPHKRSKDLLFVTPDLAEFEYHDLKPIDELVQRGESAMREAMPRLLSELKRRGMRPAGTRSD